MEAAESGWVFADDRAGAPGEGEVRRASERVTVGRVCSRVGSSPPAVVGVSGTVAACAWSPVWRSSAVKVSPPPTRATAVATTARRWFFFQRASCRRRAARPCGAYAADGACSGPGAGTAGAAVSAQGAAGGVGLGVGFGADIATGAGAMPRSTLTGAMSGA
ncbi:hypothetical protein J2X68_006551 [Streptomyces sp. 3330]|uniref:hypothetical protein n=1 Tax=Streptomyces sp. 3330 TaxID=2817755 RepID=UPI00285628E0|nr:hypothetical protein [Streptomyces sp. 3330]MDR6979814.1 hypothetical protein [Streptomyces sp. 3330]